MSRKIWRPIFFCLTFVIGGILLLWLVERAGWQEILTQIFAFGLLPFLGYVGISFVNFLVYVWRWRVILQAHLPKKDVPSFWRLFLHRMSGYAVGYLTPAAQVAGEPARIAMLALDGVPVKIGTSAVTLDIAFELVSFVLFVMAGFGFAALQNFQGIDTSVAIGILIFLFGGLMLFFATLVWGHGFLSPVARRLLAIRWKFISRTAQQLIEMESLMSAFLRKSRWILLFVLLCSFVTIGFRVVEMYYLSYFFGILLTPGQAFLSATIPGLVLFLPIPGGLGLYEGSYTSIFAALNLPLNAVAFTFIVRLRDIVFIAIGLIHLLQQGGKAVIKKGSSYEKSV
ncbi:MAG: lysylphosphatidylglycerol synthase transmembrane domain-containing protein [Patescibacteria group bacterium]|jgi:uncharacterized protein (TIRG00374 family)